ncbi:serine/arginine repetitive matrix protein 2 [Vespula squamosa]|uniref:Serine/arginine repetitive matrix protein 2 n=1 Tax=Vespula squamosa TaxID=30214 RepID=A0ABD2A859_VESSQ
MSNVAKMEGFYTTTIKRETNNERNYALERYHSTVMKKESIIRSTNESVQRAIEGLKGIPDEELQEFLDDEFMEGLNVVDAWEGEEREEYKPRIKDYEERQPSREHYRRESKPSYSREKPKREEKKREEIRRDPSKSTKDIERDKMRTKRDNENKLLAEKEKAIKHLLDSDNVVPPGTECEAIQCITDKQNEERVHMRGRRSRERRRSPERPKMSPARKKSYDRFRASPHRRMLSPVRRRSPFRMSPEKRRSSPRVNSDRRSPPALSPDRRRSPYRRLSWERRSSTDRRWSAERHRRRTEMHERRRSRSRDRQRSRSMERFRRRSRSPINRRYSPRRRSRTRSRSLERRTRKRSPFINELARQLRNEAMKSNSTYIPASSMEGISPIMNANVYTQEAEVRAPMSQSYMHQGGPSTAAQPPQAPPPPSVLPMSSQFMNFDISASSSSMGFDGAPLHPMPPAHYSSGPVMYNHNTVQTNAGMTTQTGTRAALLPTPQVAPQPVPAPGTMDHSVMGYVPQHGLPSVVSHLDPPNGKPANASVIPSPSSSSYKDRRSSLSSHNGFQPREERVKTPEPPVISDTKQFEKTSLSSLLEASVSAKGANSSSPPVLYPGENFNVNDIKVLPIAFRVLSDGYTSVEFVFSIAGFKPEILRHCEHALRELPIEDPRLKMKGRFFFDPKKAENNNKKYEEYPSNSILLQKSKHKIYWEDDEVQQQQQQQQQSNVPVAKQTVQTHQKICQTEIETDTKYVEARVDMVDFEMQVYPDDIEEMIKEERKSIMDRLDWKIRDKHRETDDLRWSLSNSSQKRPWKKGSSPGTRSAEREQHHLETVPPSPEHPPRNFKVDSPMRNRDGSYSSHRGSFHEQYVRDRYSPNCRRSANIDDFRENRSDRSHGESPMKMEDSEGDSDDTFTFQRDILDWYGKGKAFRGKANTTRGKNSGGRPLRGRCAFHKF